MGKARYLGKNPDATASRAPPFLWGISFHQKGKQVESTMAPFRPPMVGCVNAQSSGSVGKRVGPNRKFGAEMRRKRLLPREGKTEKGGEELRPGTPG